MEWQKERKMFARMTRPGVSSVWCGKAGNEMAAERGKRLSFRVALTARESLEIFHGGFSPDYAPHFG